MGGGFGFGGQRAHGFAAVAEQFAAVEVDGLDAVGAFVNRRDARVAVKLRGAALLDEAHATVNLHAEARDFDAEIGAPGFGDRRQQIFARLVTSVGRDGAGVADGAARLDLGAHQGEHTPDVWVVDDERAALTALLRIGERFLVRGFGNGDAFHADIQARRVHHREHGGEAAILFADQPALRAFIGHRAGGRSVDAHLLLNANAAHGVARSIFVAEFRHDEHRDAFRARRRAFNAGEHEVDDVGRKVVLAPGDEDFLAADGVGAIGLRRGLGGQRAKIGAGLRLGQVHGAGPFAANELF